MIDRDIIALLQELEIVLKRTITGSLFGDKSSRFRGSGLLFDQLRDYETGDDVRTLDWAGFARTGKLLTRTYYDERSYPILVVIDAADSLFYGSTHKIKYEEVVRIATLILLAAEKGQHRYGILIHARETHYIPSGKGHVHLLRCIKLLSTIEKCAAPSCRTEYFDGMMRRLKKSHMVYFLSDFLWDLPEYTIKKIARAHDVYMVRIVDPLEITSLSIALHTNGIPSVLTNTSNVSATFMQKQHEVMMHAECSVITLVVSEKHNLSRMIAFLRGSSYA